MPLAIKLIFQRTGLAEMLSSVPNVPNAVTPHAEQLLL